ncbi:MAG: phosphoenolpyruvate synthase [Desulfobacteraceae bacterium]|nr:phosphoenolpyruvate synthase [Desulfobacteraceae bacterium]
MSDVLRFIKKIFRKPDAGLSRNALTEAFRNKYEHFKALLDSNAELSKIIAEMEVKLEGREAFGVSYIQSQSARAIFHALRMIKSFDALATRKYPVLFEIFNSINSEIKSQLESRKAEEEAVDFVLPYSRVNMDVADWVGGKNASLGEICNRLNLPVPEGFAITTRAFVHFLQENDLFEEIAMKRMSLDPNNPESVNAVSQEIQRLIISAPVPDSLQDAILAAYDAMNPDGSAQQRISMRSSAIGEDSALSFAGQYLSVLNVPREQVVKTYTFIIASLFTPRAISYRLMKGIPDEHAQMSVACMRMIDSVASGVMYSIHPFEERNNNIIICAVWGLGPYAVDGVITPDNYTVDRNGEILRKEISIKPVRLVSNPEGGLLEKTVGEANRERACLSDDLIRALARYALRLEEHYGMPQDIEWALDERGKLFILQSRPLCTGMQCRSDVVKVPEYEYPLLLQSGAIASPGAGCGKAFVVRSEEDIYDFPEGSVLVAVQPSPNYMVIMPKAKAILTDFGSVTGHMASLAREFSIPTLLDTKNATSLITNGMEISVDAFSGKVYRGIVPELTQLEKRPASYMMGTPVYETLKRVAALITPLRLFDPKSSLFAPENCKSLHDIMRFVHELSYAEMFRISDLVSADEGVALKLVAPIPFDLYLIDLGGGIADGESHPRKIKYDRITCVPFNALLKGMLHEDLLHFRPRPIEFKGFLSVMSEQMLNPQHPGAERFGERSYAIISDKYLNFSSRVGYHYGVLDAYCGKTLSKNYVAFSFKGGAADDVRRNRRARAIALILKSIGMTVEVKGDRVDAKIQKLETPILLEKLDQIGRLFQFTRQLDMLMTTEGAVGAVATAFLEEKYHF